MSTPQQPELADKGRAGPVPPDNQPGHHPAEEQDKPDPNAYAAKLGLAAPEREAGAPPDELRPQSPAVPPSAVSSEASARASRPFPLGRVLLAASAGVLVLAVLRRRRR